MALRQKDLELTICLYAARMDVGGVCASDGPERATDVMKRVLQTLAATGAITNWNALSVDRIAVEFEVYTGSAEGYRLWFRTATLTPENESAIEVMCS